jgi:hypothetical protein
MNNIDRFVLILINNSFKIGRLLPSQRAMKKSSEVTKNCPKCRLSLRNQSQSQGGKTPLGVTFFLIYFSGYLVNSLEVLHSRSGTVLIEKKMAAINQRLIKDKSKIELAKKKLLWVVLPPCPVEKMLTMLAFVPQRSMAGLESYSAMSVG